MRICGMDEVGRGALAGSLIAAATILNDQYPISNLRDSKKLSKKQREGIFKDLLDAKIEYAVEEISVEEINTYGIGWANKEIFTRLKNRLKADKYIIDGLPSLFQSFGGVNNVECMIKADTAIPEVMAASIIAKVTRDEHMIKLHDEHVMYGWDTNVGYGTKKHIEALKTYGVTKHHRVKFVKTALRNHKL